MTLARVRTLLQQTRTPSYAGDHWLGSGHTNRGQAKGADGLPGTKRPARMRPVPGAPNSATTTGPAPGDRRSFRRARTALWVMIAGAAVVLALVDRRQWFTGDEFDILGFRGLTAPPGGFGLLEAHYGHWVTVPILAYRALFDVFGMRSYWPYLVLLFVVHLAVVVMLWYVMVRAAVDVWVALAACTLFAVLGIGFETLTAAWNMQLVLPLATGLAALLLLPEDGALEWRDAVVVVLLVAGLMSAGTGVPMLLTVAIVDLVRRRWRVTLAIVALPAVLYGAWYLQYSDSGLPVGVDSSPGKAPKFVWEGVTGAFADVARIHVLGYLVGIAVAVWLVVQLTKRPIDRNLLVPGALALSGVVLLAMTGWRRGNLISVSPTTSRYAYLTVAFLVPLTAMAAQHLFHGSRARQRPVGGGGRRCGDRAGTFAHDLAQPWEAVKQQDRGAVLATAQLVREGHPFLLQSPLGFFEPQMTVAKITEFDRDGKLESLDHATLADRLTVLARLTIDPTTDGPRPGLARGPPRSRPGGGRPCRRSTSPHCRARTKREGRRRRSPAPGGPHDAATPG